MRKGSHVQRTAKWYMAQYSDVPGHIAKRKINSVYQSGMNQIKLLQQLPKLGELNSKGLFCRLFYIYTFLSWFSGAHSAR